MVNSLNQRMLEELVRDFAGVRSCVFLSVQGMNAIEISNLRAGFAEWNVKFLVVKNSVATRALAANQITGLDEFFVGATAVAFGESEVVIRGAKVLSEVMKTSKAIVIKGGYFEGAKLNSEQAIALSKLPTKKELFASILGGVVSLLSAPPSLVQSLLSKPAYLAKAYADKKSA